MDISKLKVMSERQLGRKLGKAKRDLISQQASNTRTQEELKEGKAAARTLTLRIELLGDELAQRVKAVRSSHGESVSSQGESISSHGEDSHGD
jgi:hypothetical protein